MRHVGWSSLGVAAAAALCALGPVGCAGKFTGGGWIDSRAGAPAKATMGFNLQATGEDGGDLEYRGQFQYSDHGSFAGFPDGVAIHGVIDEVNIAEDIILGSLGFGGLGFDFGPDGLPGNAVLFTGTYTPQPESLGDGGAIEGVVVAGGISDLDDPRDFVVIHLIGGVYDGYANGGFIQGGSFKYHPTDP
ncbi:MAG TPA: hypothetical protein VFG68_22490 [Fimbriiglobus sp.]|nr:hypothetical protein [Fimbriiglobus sp.]